MGEEGGLHRLEELQRRAGDEEGVEHRTGRGGARSSECGDRRAVARRVERHGDRARGDESCSASITITVEPANTAPARSVRFSGPVAGDPASASITWKSASPGSRSHASGVPCAGARPAT